MRYFHIAYSLKYPNGNLGYGSLTTNRINFPSKNQIDEQVKKDCPDFETLVVESIFEFKNKKDFDSFIAP